MLRGEKIVFTGKLDTLSQKQAQDLVSALGGKLQAAVTKDTTILVIGKANTNLFQEDPRSLKMHKVEALQQEGYSVCVLSEQSFLEKALSPSAPESSSRDHERESWIGPPVYYSNV